ncbi:MAG: LemA family protein [Proteobacteria bacterium]|jgi:LemA protein|nr:LemA family protein [Pseudomonadota bacterium]
MNKTLLIILGVIAVIILAVFSSYNGLVGSSQAVDKSWADVQNVYQRRADLIPNLVQTVQGAANFEKSTIVQVTEARASVGKVQINQNQAPTDAAQLAQFQQAQGQLGSALSRLLVVAENYPDLKATANFRDLQAQLEGTENRIAVARKNFNDAVQEYNVKIKTLPAVFFAGILGFQPKPYFQAVAGAETAPTVKFDFNGAPAAK